MTALEHLRFFTTPAHKCSYLEGEQAITLFVGPDEPVDDEAYALLSAAGFRRSGGHIYRPYCGDCQACIPARVPVASFKPSRSQKRIVRRNRDLVVQAVTPAITDEIYRVYDKYIRCRHADGDMYPPSPDQFRSFLVDGRPETTFYNFRLDGQLVAVMVVDQLIDSCSAIYTFFEPSMARRSLGVFAVLWLIQYTRQLGLRHVYLGYWIRESQKMAYKANYRPIELLLQNRWQLARDDP